MFRTQRRVVDAGNRFAQTTDFLQRFSRDVRRATAVRLTDADETGVHQVLLIGEPPNAVTYRFAASGILRSAREGTASAVETEWNTFKAEAAILGAPGADWGSVARVTVRWSPIEPKVPEPRRRFDLVVRAVGEASDDDD
jgi:hypothetical protein